MKKKKRHMSQCIENDVLRQDMSLFVRRIKK